MPNVKRTQVTDTVELFATDETQIELFIEPTGQIMTRLHQNAPGRGWVFRRIHKWDNRQMAFNYIKQTFEITSLPRKS